MWTHRDPLVRLTWPALSVAAIVVVRATAVDAQTRRPAQAEALRGYVGERTLLTLGSPTGELLHGVVDGAICEASIVIAQRSTGTLLFFSRNGKLQKTAGGLGQGPGEFSRIGWMRHARGNLTVYDLSLRRLTEFSCDGTLVRVQGLGRTSQYRTLGAVGIGAVGVFGDGTVLAETWKPTARVQGPTVVRNPTTLVRLDLDRGTSDSVGFYQGRESYKEPFGRGGESIAPLVFGRQSMALAFDRTFIVVRNDDNVLSVYDWTGRSVRQLQVPPDGKPAAVTKEDVARARSLRGEKATAPQSILELYDRMPVPDLHASFGWFGFRSLSLMRVTRTGDVWIVNRGGVWGDAPVWTVFSASGRLKGQIAARSEVELLDANDEYALLLVWDADDVERVELRQILWNR